MVEQGGKLITHHSVKHTAGLLGVHQAIIDLTGRFQSRFNRALRNFVKFDTVEPRFIQSEHRLQMPRNRFPFSIRVGCEIDAVRSARCVRQTANDVLFPFGIDVFRLEIVLNINAERVHGQIADMPCGGVYAIFAFQVFGDGFRLGRRLYDN